MQQVGKTGTGPFSGLKTGTGPFSGLKQVQPSNCLNNLFLAQSEKRKSALETSTYLWNNVVDRSRSDSPSRIRREKMVKTSCSIEVAFIGVSKRLTGQTFSGLKTGAGRCFPLNLLKGETQECSGDFNFHGTCRWSLAQHSPSELGGRRW